MPALPIRIWPDPVLATRAEPVAEVTAQTRSFVADLFTTMYASKGIGLAANQVGVLQRVLVIDLDPERQRSKDEDLEAELQECNFVGPIAIINPEIIASEGEIVWDEGCLSVPGITDTVRRKAHITVRCLDEHGKTQTFEAAGLYAVCIQHEMDHLNGRVFVEYLSKLKRDVIRRKMMRLKGNEKPAGGGRVAS